MTTQLSSERVVSSIPRLGKASGESDDVKEQSADNAIADPTTSRNWVYPSPAQFFAAMERKNHNPQAQDMNIVVPIHNAVNERAWQQILEWEKVADSGSWSACGGPQLVSFKGRPKDLTWKAWAYGVLGYQKPFDRHDWEIDRCGQRIKYVIDFYTGRTTKSDARTSLSFYLDVRPSPASVEGIRMRVARFFTRPAAQPQHSSA
jgi:cytochrome c heme-lyase